MGNNTKKAVSGKNCNCLLSNKKSVIETLSWIFAVVFCTFLLGAVGISVVREYDKHLFPAHMVTQDAGLTSKWLRSVKNGDVSRALLLASSLVSDNISGFPDPDYLTMLKNNGLSSNVLTTPFGIMDFIRWQDAIKLNKLARQHIRSSETAVTDLLKTVIEKVQYCKTGGKSNYPPYSIMKIWERGRGNNADRARLFSALVFQTGRRVCMVALLDKHYRHIHYLCEIRDKNGISVVDIPFKKGWQGTSIAYLRKHPELLPAAWPSTIRDAFQTRILFLVPAELADYRPCNQKLNKKLTGVPRFGIDPDLRIKNYFSESDAASSTDHGYWQVPIIAIYSARNRPHNWLIRSKK